MRLLTTAAVLTALAAPLPALAEERAAPPPPAPAAASEAEAAAARTAAAMADPQVQHEMAMMLRAMSEVVLDMPLGPMAQAMAEATGEKAKEIAPGTTLRSMAPEVAGKMPELVEKGVPAAMQAMGAMAKGAAAMTPAMRAMAERMAPLAEAMKARMKDLAPPPPAQ